MCVSVKFYSFIFSSIALRDKVDHNGPRLKKKKHSKYKSRKAGTKTLVKIPINSRTQVFQEKKTLELSFVQLQVTISVALSL